MAEKKYYWLRLKRDFFKRHDIRIIEAMPNGKDYVLFYLKLMVESVGHEGALRFSETIPYNEDMLATITNTNVDIVRCAMKLFQELKMVEILDDATIYMNEVEALIGSETKWAEKKRLYRQKEDNVPELSPICLPDVRQEKEIEIEKDTDKEKETEKRINYQRIVDMYNDTCVSFPKIRSLSVARKKAIKARLNSYTEEDFQTLFQKAEASSFLKGKNIRNWSATFDWMISDEKMAKVLDGNYDDEKGANINGQSGRDPEPRQRLGRYI